MTDWVVLDGGAVSWAIEARRIREIKARAEWTREAIDPGVLWGQPSPPPTRVVVIDDDLALLATRLGFRALEGERVVPLPKEWDAKAKELVEGLIFDDDGDALVVLHVEALRWQQ
jgi:hypothetical protein